MAWTWTLFDAQGGEMRSSEDFDSKEAAEAWMTSSWSQLAEEGAASVSLRNDGDEEYLMSLAPE